MSRVLKVFCGPADQQRLAAGARVIERYDGFVVLEAADRVAELAIGPGAALALEGLPDEPRVIGAAAASRAANFGWVIAPTAPLWPAK